MNHRMWNFSANEIRFQLCVFAIVTWTFAAFNLLAPGERYRTGSVKGGDFVHFYVLGSLALEDRSDLLYDARAQQVAQLRLVPPSKDFWFLPIYGPQTALLFAPFAKLPYPWAVFAWAVTTMSVYVVCAWAIWRRSPGLPPDFRLAAIAALGFTPSYKLIASGQTSVLPLACMTLGFLAMRADRKWWAGVALGSLIIKPQLGLAVAVVMVARREWHVVAGAFAAIAVQWGSSVLLFGFVPLLSYFDMLRKGFQLAGLLEPKPFQLHSLRAFWMILLQQPTASTVAYVLSSVLTLALLVFVWRKAVPLEVKYSALILATVLVSPHLGAYELVLLAPALILTAGHAERLDVRCRRTLRGVLYLAYLVPVTGAMTPLTRIQLTVPTYCGLLVALWWLVRTRRADPQYAYRLGTGDCSGPAQTWPTVPRAPSLEGLVSWCPVPPTESPLAADCRRLT